MKISKLIFIAMVLSISLISAHEYSFGGTQEKAFCRKKNPNEKITSVIKKPLRYVDNLPEQWRWDTSLEKNYLTYMKNQHIPEYCGACWAFSATSALSDRIKIQRNATFPDIQISPQVLLSCSMENDGCHGGYGYSAYNWIYHNEITDDTCSPYRARGHDNGFKCSNTTMCKDCPGGGKKDCFVPDSYNVYNIEEFGSISGEEAMMQEIFQRGPIVCGVAVPNDLFKNYTGGIYEDKSGDMDIVHDISVVGYGVENGVKYWLVRNSWGTFWGEKGFFRVVRGKNNIAIETECAFAVPKDTWTENKKHITTDEEKNDPNNETENSDGRPDEFLNKNKFQACMLTEPKLSPGERIVDREALKFNEAEIPKVWDWRDINGTNYLSIPKNQHIPTYCGSCWAHGTTSALTDRFHILNGPSYMPISISTQVVVNCQPGGGSCFGGNPLDVYEFAYLQGIPDDTCQQYIAKNHKAPLCTASQICQDCAAPPAKTKEESGKVRCHPIEKYRSFYVKEYGRVSGASNMKAEIFKRGPIDCAIEVTDKFEKYTSGIYEEHKAYWSLNHAISVVGFGVENGVEYWIVRNSWGTYWGEGGFFRMRMHKWNNGIEEDCNWAVPSYENVSKAGDNKKINELEYLEFLD